MSRRPPMPSKEQIVAGQTAIIIELGVERPLEHCWACGFDTTLYRCHIHAHRDGGSMDPSNFFLLCHLCHTEQPDNASREAQIFWVKNREWYTIRIARNVRPYVDAVMRGEMTTEQVREQLRALHP